MQVNSAAWSGYLTAMDLIDALDLAGIKCVIAGGAARDAYHQIKPKDFDLVVLSDFDINDIIQRIEDMPEKIDYEPFGAAASMQASPDANLDWVVKLVYSDVSFDLIQFANLPSTPIEVCESFDCTLNMAWIGGDGEINFHDRYPEVGDKVELLPTCDFPARRVKYLKEKYPQYQWPTQAELEAHPNYKQGH